MAQVSFDTLKFAKNMESLGFPAVQAEGLSEEIRKSHEALDLATKRDLEDVRKDLSTEIIGVRAEIEKRGLKTDAEIEKRGLKTDASIAAVLAEIEQRGLKTDSEMAKQTLKLIGILGGLMAGGFTVLGLMVKLF